MMDLCPGSAGQLRLVGDPVDVVTGANVDGQLEFQFPGRPPFIWQRHYDSSKAGQHFKLGWGHSHEYDYSLRFDLDGIRYTRPLGDSVGFPLLPADGDRHSVAAFTLIRDSARRYRLLRPGASVREFQFKDVDRPAPLVAMSKARGRLEFEYDHRGHLAGIREASGRQIAVESDPGSGRILRLFRPESRGEDRTLITYAYDGRGNLVGGRDAYGNQFAFAYDEHNRMVRKTDRRGYSFHFRYDEKGRCVEARGEDGVAGVRLRYVGDHTVVTREDGGEWTYRFTPDGAVTHVVDPYGGVRRLESGPDGRIVEEVDPLGNSLLWIHDAAGNLLGKSTPEGRFLPKGTPKSAFRRPSHELPESPLEFQFGRLLRSDSIRPPWSGTILADNVPRGVADVVRRTSPRERLGPRGMPRGGRAETDPKADARLVYGELGRLVREDYPDGTSRRWSYDPNGNVAQLVDRNGSRYRFDYASWNHPRRSVDPLEGVTSFEHSTGERLSVLLDPGGTRSEYVYDLKDRLVEVRRHGKVRERYEYDLADNLVRKESGSGEVLLTQEIGPGNRVMKRSLASGGVHGFEYDDLGRFSRIEWDGHEATLAHDEDGRRTADLRNGSGVETTYENGVLMSSVVLGRYMTTYTRAPDGTHVITDPTGEEHRIASLGCGLVLRQAPSGTCELSQFGREGRCLLTSFWTPDVPDRPLTRRYRYSPEGDLVRVDDGTTVLAQYTYDEARRLVGVLRPGGWKGAFEYDQADNLVRRPGGPVVEVTRGNQVGKVDGRPVWYDERDHVSIVPSNGSSRRFEYDARGMLRRCVLDESLAWEADYDPLGRRICTRGPGGTTEFIWDGDRLAAEIHGDGRVRVYVYAAPLALTPIGFVDYDDSEAPLPEGRSYSVFSNQIATPVRVEDRTGTAVWAAEIEPYGQAHVQVNEPDFDCRLRFPGHYYDPETGLHYNRFRYYDPNLGRYLQSDPLGVAGGINLYGYTPRPLNSVDIRGLNCEAHPAGYNPNCEECEDNEDTQIWGHPPQPPDPDLLARIGDPSLVITGHPHFNPRGGEYPYEQAPEIYRVEPGRPLDVNALDTERTYLWAVDSEGTIWVAPEDQPDFRDPAEGRRLTHGHLVPTDNERMRGEGRAGGELNYNDDQGEWVMDNDSSYTFNRMDGQRSTGDSLDASHDLLSQSGTDTSEIATANNRGQDADSPWRRR
jgi:RHS repeat-associated protein